MNSAGDVDTAIDLPSVMTKPSFNSENFDDEEILEDEEDEVGVFSNSSATFLLELRSSGTRSGIFAEHRFVSDDFDDVLEDDECGDNDDCDEGFGKQGDVFSNSFATF